MKILVMLLAILSMYTFSYAQEKRLLLLFADHTGNQLLKEQQHILQENINGLKERDLEVKTYYADRDKPVFQARKIKTAFTIILIGKDGGEKLRSSKPLSLAKLFGTIDAMPMRQEEMKHPH